MVTTARFLRVPQAVADQWARTPLYLVAPLPVYAAYTTTEKHMSPSLLGGVFVSAVLLIGSIIGVVLARRLHNAPHRRDGRDQPRLRSHPPVEAVVGPVTATIETAGPPWDRLDSRFDRLDRKLMLVTWLIALNLALNFITLLKMRSQ
jgi:hypothetical protein